MFGNKNNEKISGEDKLNTLAAGKNRLLLWKRQKGKKRSLRSFLAGKIRRKKRCPSMSRRWNLSRKKN